MGESNVAIDPAIGGYGVADIYLGEFSPQLPSTDRRRRLGAPRPSCAHLWSRRARSRHLPCVAKRHGPSSAVACLAEAVALLGLVLPFSGLPAAFWGSRHLRSVLGVRGSLVSLVGELVRKAQLGHQPNLGFCLLVSQQTLALYFFFAFFCAFFFFFVGASESLPEPLALDWAAILPFCSGGLPSTRPRRGATQANRISARARRAVYFFWDRARMRRLSTFLSILRVDLSPGDRSEACSRAGQPGRRGVCVTRSKA